MKWSMLSSLVMFTVRPFAAHGGAALIPQSKFLVSSAGTILRNRGLAGISSGTISQEWSRPELIRVDSSLSTTSSSSDTFSVSSLDSCEFSSTSGQQQTTHTVTVLGYGSLLSEKSARSTFPELQNFRLGRVTNYRRVFAQPASIFFAHGIADLETLQIASVSAEYDAGNSGFIVSVFDMIMNATFTQDYMPGTPPPALVSREASYEIMEVPYVDLANPQAPPQYGFLSVKSTDESYKKRWGEERFHDKFTKYGIATIWHWGSDSGIRPCAVYLRHCYLGAKSMGEECLNSFLDETYLIDRKTTIRQYLEQHPEVLDTVPPPSLALRYNG